MSSLKLASPLGNREFLCAQFSYSEQQMLCFVPHHTQKYCAVLLKIHLHICTSLIDRYFVYVYMYMFIYTHYIQCSFKKVTVYLHKGARKHSSLKDSCLYHLYKKYQSNLVAILDITLTSSSKKRALPLSFIFSGICVHCYDGLPNWK